MVQARTVRPDETALRSPCANEGGLSAGSDGRPSRVEPRETLPSLRPIAGVWDGSFLACFRTAARVNHSKAKECMA